MSFDSVRKHNRRYTKSPGLSVLEPVLASDEGYGGKNRDRNGGEEAKIRGNEGGAENTGVAEGGLSSKTHSKSTVTWANEEDDTEMAGTIRGKTNQQEEDFLVKWQLPGNLDAVTAKRQITTLLGELMSSFNDVTFIDHKKREWRFNEKDDYEKFLKEVNKATIQVHPVKNQQQKIIRWITITKFRATSKISDWKNNDFFYDQVLEFKAYIFPHPFKYDEWDITSIGFLKNTHTTHVTQEYLHDLISEYIQPHDINLPKFQLIPQKITNQERTATTRAYTVQCAKSDAKRMSELLTKGEFRTTQMFIPFKYKRSQPDLFTKCIKQQNEVYYKTWVVKLEGISKEVMHFMVGEIQSMAGVYQVVPTKKIQQSGEWKILVEQAKSPFIHRQLEEKWQNIMSNVPQNFLENSPASWSLPRISSQKIRDYQDDASNDSYGSLLTNGTNDTNDSVMTYGDDILHELPEEYKYPSYAAVAAPPTSTATTTTTSSPTVSDLSEWQKEKSELEALVKRQESMLAQFQAEQTSMIREMQHAHTLLINQLKTDQATQIDKLQADIEVKVSRSKDLEDQLAQAIDLAYKRHSREDEMLDKFEKLMKHFPVTDAMNPTETPAYATELALYEKPHTTPPRTNTSKESPPPKKANTNSSPQRNIYNIFKPPSGRVLRSSHKHMPSPTRLLTQPMDEDDDSDRPMPMAALGKKQE
jgi:hypothetical protein